MTELRVWAPLARTMAVETGGRTLAMQAAGDGWWTCDDTALAHGAIYALRVDGEGPFPDPRSPWQPTGVHGPSRRVDHDRFDWSDAGWRPPPLSAAVVYELHVGTFTPEGTFDAAVARLDHLVDLGVTHVELMPVAAFPGDRGWGYDGVALYAPHHAYGGPEGLVRLVDACHARGLAVLLDVVYNHLGPDGNYLRQFGPYFTDRYTTPWGEAVNLDGRDSDEVRRFFIDNALMWLRDYHIDGLRLDAVHAIFDTSAIHFLAQLADEVADLEAALGRHLVLVAESDLNDPRLVRPAAAGGLGLDAQWNEDFHHALHAALTGERDGYYADFGRVGDLAAVLSRGFRYDGCHSAYRGRRHGAPATGVSGHAFVGCLQNHDQVGNRAAGERTSHLLSPQQLRLGAALVFTAPLVPMIFQGEEWGASTPFQYFTDHQDTDLAEMVREGRRREFAAFGWDPEMVPDPQDPATFARSRLDWSELARAPHRDLLDWHRELIALRERLPVLRDGRRGHVTVDHDEDAGWLTLRRGEVLLVANFADASRQVPVGDLAGRRCVLRAPDEVDVSGGLASVPAYGVAIYA